MVVYFSVEAIKETGIPCNNVYEDSFLINILLDLSLGKAALSDWSINGAAAYKEI